MLELNVAQPYPPSICGKVLCGQTLCGVVDNRKALKQHFFTDGYPKQLRVRLYRATERTGIYPADTLFPSDSVYPRQTDSEPVYSFESSQIVSESMVLKEGICGASALDYSSAYSASFSVQVVGVAADAIGMELVAEMLVDQTVIPLFHGYVTDVKRNEGTAVRQITAYDRVYSGMKESALELVTGQVYPITLRELAESAATEAGMALEMDPLPADHIRLTAPPVLPTRYTIRELLGQYAELNGRFLRQSRTGQLTFIKPASFVASYPSDTRYPDDNIYPGAYSNDPNSDTAAWAMRCKRGDYYTRELSGILLYDLDGAVIGSYGDLANAYQVQDNLLASMILEADRSEACSILGSEIFTVRYLPHDSEMVGMPWMEPGDVVHLPLSETDSVDALILERTLSGIISLHDKIKADGDEYLSNRYQVRSIK